MRWMQSWSCALFFLVAASGACQQSPSSSDPLRTLQPGHPRLILLDSDLPALKASIAADPFAAATFAELRKNGDAMLRKPVNVYAMTGSEKNLLGTARDVEKVVVTLSALYRLTGDKAYAVRAEAEMEAASGWTDWMPSHFLDAAELTAALAIGYDWLYAALTPAQRQLFREAIVSKGLDPFLAGMVPTAPHSLSKLANNWVQVCHGGETLGALAVAEDEPAKAAAVLRASFPAMQKIMQLFAPDGGFEEGPTYWGYATMYNVLYLSALDSALGTDFGLSAAPGFAETGAYHVQSIGPDYRLANFGDAHEPAFRAPQMFWMASKFHKPEYAVQERRFDEAYASGAFKHNDGESIRFLAFGLIYYKPALRGAEPATVQSFERVGQAYLRSGWSKPDGSADADAWYVAFKGGAATASHGHLDLGSFVMDAMGERWAIDLGAETYGVPKYFDFKHTRWTYFRTQTQSHNTLTVGDENQDLDAVTHLSDVKSAPDGSRTATLNLDSAYKGRLLRWSRTVSLARDQQMTVRDEVTPSPDGADLVWRWFTRASVKLAEGEGAAGDAVLTQNGKALRLHISSPTGAKFTLEALPTLPAPQEPIDGIREIAVRLPKVHSKTTILVVATPVP